jgi:glycosyltransferase involved in cell wall biosynthesis
MSPPPVNTLGVVLPTLNSMAALPGHLRTLRLWQHLADQIVVVDSFSTDGTWDFLQQNLRHPHVSFFQQPPGLYPSWNFGVSHLKTRYTYVATVGDTITQDGISHLLRHAAELEAGVLVSKPAFMVDETDKDADIFWPVDDLINQLGVTAPRALSWLEVFLFTAVHLDGTLLGSSASNLYRTDVLQQFPFPSEFGKAGDAAWGLQHFADVKWAVTPDKFSTFLRHPDTTAPSDRRKWKSSTRLDTVLRTAMADAVAAGRIPQSLVKDYGLPELVDASGLWLEAKQAFDRSRSGRWPWYLNPVAWGVRSTRERQRARLLAERDAILAHLKTDSGDGS